MNATLLVPGRTPPAGSGVPAAALAKMAADLWQVRIGASDMRDKETMIAAYRRHNGQVRRSAPPERSEAADSRCWPVDFHARRSS